jgi:hypothetical protein
VAYLVLLALSQWQMQQQSSKTLEPGQLQAGLVALQGKPMLSHKLYALNLMLQP